MHYFLHTAPHISLSFSYANNDMGAIRESMLHGREPYGYYTR
jgi:hypothetical protein